MMFTRPPSKTSIHGLPSYWPSFWAYLIFDDLLLVFALPPWNSKNSLKLSTWSAEYKESRLITCGVLYKLGENQMGQPPQDNLPIICIVFNFKQKISLFTIVICRVLRPLKMPLIESNWGLEATAYFFQIINTGQV
jgi:hypothetical protein